MAGNKMTTKNKGKDDKSKGCKIVPQTGEDNEDLDFTILRKPVLTSITGFAQARKIFDVATEELKDLLTNECDLLYECKVCRNIFRSLVNFISHKRIYCQETFNSTVHGHFIYPTSTVNEIQKIRRTEQQYQESLRNKHVKNNEEDDDRIPLSKDLTEVVERIAQVKGTDANDEQNVALQKIPTSSVAVYQNLCTDEKDTMRSQICELHEMLSRDNAVLQSDGRVAAEGEQVIQISDDEDGQEGAVLKCRICDLQFSTQKTLKFHMKNKHVESRLVYPCPDCLEIFSTSWSVYRHLFKVHRKTAAQIRRMRESIQAKAFRMNNPPAAYERRRAKPSQAASVPPVSSEDSQDQENQQAWMENLEGLGLGLGSGARCGGCGRGFWRRAALLAHTNVCAHRHRALQGTVARKTDRKIEIQIRKDYNKGPHGVSILKNVPPADPKSSDDVDQTEDKKDQDGVDEDVEEEKDPLEDAPMDVDERSNDSADSPEKNKTSTDNEIKPLFRLPFAMQAEKSNLAAFRQRVHTDIEVNKLLCKKCDTALASISELYGHMADHYKWMRYACKLCNYKHYNFDNLPEHVRVVHKLKGDSDFYISTVKAIDGTEAMILSRCLAEAENTDDKDEPSETSPESRRPSRCSSDSSRLSDDSSSSSNLKDIGTRKRKMYQAKTAVKRKKEAEQEDEPKEGPVSLAKVLKSIIGGKESPSPVKAFDENSSDIEDVEEKTSKKTMPAASKRPVRKRTKPKNEDFEYDLSNLLKLEAQGYRESRTEITQTKTTQPKKKVQQESPVVFDVNKDYVGALVTLSKKAVDTSSAHLKTNFTIVPPPPPPRASNVFARPMLPKILQRSSKLGSRKEIETEDLKDGSSPNKEVKPIDTPLVKDIQSINKSVEEPTSKIEIVNVKSLLNENAAKGNVDESEQTSELKFSVNNINAQPDKNELNSVTEDKAKSNMNISALLPLKLRRPSLDIMKNPIINKNISELNKAGMKTKILVIKPINRNKDANTTSSSSALKFQTIKLKDPSSQGLNNDENKQSDQVVVVKVPKVDCAVPRTVSDSQVTNCEKIATSINDTNIDNSKPSIKDSNIENFSYNETVDINKKPENDLTNESTWVEKLEEAVSNADEILEESRKCNKMEVENEAKELTNEENVEIVEAVKCS